MKTLFYPLWLRARHHRLFVFATVLLCGTSIGLNAQHSSDSARTWPASAWVHSFYGKNNAGVGIGVRHSAFGIAFTTFGFAGDTAAFLSPRPGMTAMSLDLLLILDITRWMAPYGSIGCAGRVKTYPEEISQLRGLHRTIMLSVGGGFQFTIGGHYVLGLGYNGIVDSEAGREATYDVIHSGVVQVGWRW